MSLQEIFTKSINRPIETVIKADDQDNIRQEVEEYVVTNEVAKKIRDFFAAYTNYYGANGVWISGFFGSGKSHLLKILSYVLENREDSGLLLGEVFASKLVGDEMLKADVVQATRIPSESILFNIDQQAQITSKQEQDAILTVFYKVLNDHLGFFGGQNHVADFERWLTTEGVYEAFKQKFEHDLGEPWTTGRRKYFSPKVKDAIDRVLTALHGPTAEGYKNVIDDLRKDSAISIEDFCTKVNHYIETKPKGFRLNFFVDEVGQYISDNTKLMLNLQTIAETLATRTKGQAWILVTSQEDMEKVVGDMNKAQQNDFSRIQARFKIKVPLSSANVDEVIEKRLLEKKQDAQKLLVHTWQKEHANLETLLTFSEVGVQFKGYKEEKNFVNKYPFVPYQFDLFQQCIKALSHHNAFQGKNASVGERSMLGVFQDVLMRMGNAQVDALVTFDLLYEGIRSTIRGEIQSSITLAERNLDDAFAIQVLKALFLVKYYSNFKTTPRNISVLMIDNIHVDLKAHEQRIQQALGLLEAQTYVQRNGELYEFLTDDEKDIEEEIKATDVDESAITQLLNELAFDEVIRDTKIKYSENKQDYEFAHKIDGSVLGREKELVIDIITPNHDDYEHRDRLAAQSMGRNTMMMVVLPPNERLLKDVRLYLKTDKYIKQSQSTNNKESIKRLLYEKGTQNSERRRTLILLLKQLLGEADILLNGSKYEVGNAADGRVKVTNAFQGLVKIAYPNLKMLGSTAYSEDTIKQTIKAKQNDLFGTDDSTMSEPENEVLNYIIRRKKQSERTSLTEVKDQFVKKPYGWSQNAIWTMVARLYKRGKLDVRQDGGLLGDDALLTALLNNRLQATTLLEPQVDIDPQLVRDLKEVYSELFDQTCAASEAKEVATAFRSKLSEELVFVKELVAQRTHFPFLASLEPLRDTLDKLSRKELNYLLLSRKEFEDELLDAKENLLDPIKRFWSSELKKIYEEIRSFLKGDLSNFEHIDGDEMTKLEAASSHTRPYSGAIIQEAKAAMDSMRTKVLAKLKEEKEKALARIEQHRESLKANSDFQKLTNGQQESLLKQLSVLGEKVADTRYISNIRGHVVSSNELYVSLLNEIQALLRRNTPQPEPDCYQKSGEDTPPAQESKVEYVQRTKVEVSFKKSTLETEQDVEDYVSILKQAYIKQIKENKRITL
ncbi:BREX system P-loop protein BrxC [Hymenobacter sp. BT491]|uniref:BREX system P-loop protein BrxC n=1 Tax=Hymenobacter sp. BT491 TaxID=2766779 RepID=UPI0016535EB6|nr:BREX system P-loop protein BrxC [Hymenobacter sp. BT491]MBC6992229.1 BREX system P-loop protein BrxC [Hymenobacter sp. BT491]